MNRKEQQTDLLISLGMLFGPLRRMFEKPAEFDQYEKGRIVARFFSDVDAFLRSIHDFTESEEGYDYFLEKEAVHRSIQIIFSALKTINDPNMLLHLNNCIEQIKGHILAIPIPLDSTIHASVSPFSTYRLLRSVCSATQREIVWLDRYFDHSIFYRYFADVPPTVPITLITRADTSQRQTAFVAMSRLFAQERGPSGYRLIFNQNFHDRSLRCDDTLLALGGSIKELGDAPTFTISRLDSTPENKQHFNDAIRNGSEQFGLNQTTHL